MKFAVNLTPLLLHAKMHTPPSRPSFFGIYSREEEDEKGSAKVLEKKTAFFPSRMLLPPKEKE